MSGVMRHARLPRSIDSAPLDVIVDGEHVQAYPGETVATVLLAMGRQTLRHTSRLHEPRGLFCGMGVCFDCLVTIDGQPDVRACMTTVQPGMVIATVSQVPDSAPNEEHQGNLHPNLGTGGPSDA